MMNQGIDYQLIDDQSFEDIQNDDIVKVLFETLDMAYLQSLEPMMKDIIEGEVALSYSSGRYMELNLLGVDKGQGLRDLAQLDIPLVQTIAVGINYNDQDMLEVAGLSVAAGNAVDEIKKIW